MISRAHIKCPAMFVLETYSNSKFAEVNLYFPLNERVQRKDRESNEAQILS